MVEWLHNNKRDYSLLAKSVLSLNSLTLIRFSPYVYEPNASSHFCSSNGHLSICIWQMVLNVAGPLQTQFPLKLTEMSVTNLLVPPAKLIESSPLEINDKSLCEGLSFNSLTLDH